MIVVQTALMPLAMQCDEKTLGKGFRHLGARVAKRRHDAGDLGGRTGGREGKQEERDGGRARAHPTTTAEGDDGDDDDEDADVVSQ